MEFETVNANPVVHTPSLSRRKALAKSAEDWVDESEERDEMDAEEIFDMVRQIDDPEHPLTLEELQVVTLEQVEVDDARNLVTVRYTPTIPHCSMATLIGLCIRVKLMRSLPPRFKLKVEISPGKHSSEAAVNKQLNDKERVAAALENAPLIAQVQLCLRWHEDAV